MQGQSVSIQKQKEETENITLSLHPKTQYLLSLEYKQQFPKQLNLRQLYETAIEGMQTNILKLKYGLKASHIQRYKINLEKVTTNPLCQEESNLTTEIMQLCQIILSTKDYGSINQAISRMNQLMGAGMEKDQIQEKENPGATPEDDDQKNESIVSEKITEITEHQKFQLKLRLADGFSLFSLNFTYINIKQAMIYETLSRCQMWFTICRERRKSKKAFHLDPLINVFQHIVQKYQFQESPFHVSVLPRKNIRRIEKKSKIQKSKNPLFDAVCNKDYDEAKKLILNGSDIQALALSNNRIAREITCAHKAAQLNDLKMCRLLTSFGVNWQSEDSQNMTPIYYAIQGRSFQALVYLVEQVKVDIEKQQIQNRTPFYWATTEGQIAYIEYLYKKGANINHKSKLGRCPLSKSCYLGRRDVVQYLLSCKQIDINSQDQKGRSALHNATFGPKGGRQGQKFGTNNNDSPECAQLLLEKGLNVDILDFQDNSSLHIAMSSEALDSIRLLMAYGASMEIRNNYKETPIMTGAKFGHVDGVKLLYEQYGSSITDKDIFDKNIVLLVAKFRKLKDNTLNFLKQSKKETDQEMKTLVSKRIYQQSEMNPVFQYIVSKFIQELYVKPKEDETKMKGLEQLHYTFKQMLCKVVHQEFLHFTKQMLRYNIPLPELSLKQIKHLLEKEEFFNKENQQAKTTIISLLHGKNKEGKGIFQLEHETMLEFVKWIIQNNNIKLLESVLELESLFLHSFKKIKHLDGQMQAQKFEYYYQLPIQILIQSLNVLKQKVITFCLLELDFDWISFIDQKNTEGNILHFLIRNRKVGCLIQIMKFLSGKKLAFIKNRHLLRFSQKQDDFNKQFQGKQLKDLPLSPLSKIQSILLGHKDKDNLSPYHLAHIMKESSAIKVIEQGMKQSHVDHEFKWEIRQFKIQEDNDALQKKIFDMGYEQDSQLEQLIDKVNKAQSKQELSKIVSILQPEKNKVSKDVNIDNIGQYWYEMTKKRSLIFVKAQADIIQKNKLSPILQASVVGIDVEYDFSSDKSATIISTIQFSTLQADYIVDMMSCSFENGQNRYPQFVKLLKQTLFKPLATNIGITKLMHGSDHDLYILKSCFNVSFVNFLDSSRIDIDLKKTNSIRGLSKLVKEYLNIEMSKDHQVSEWKIRPIPFAMLDYARRDSMVMPFLVRSMLLRFDNLDNLKMTIINGFKHAKKNKKLNQPLIKNIIPKLM